MRVREVVAPCRLQLPSKTRGGAGPVEDVDEVRCSPDQSEVVFYRDGRPVHAVSDELGVRTIEVVT